MTIHLIINILIVACSGLAGWRLARRGSRSARMTIVAAALVGVAGFALSRRPDIFTMIFPFSSAVFYADFWYPFAIMMLIPAALRFGRTRFHRIRIALLCLVLFGLSLKPYKSWFLPIQESREHIMDENGVCRQSTADTCSAAAAVTLLHHYGINSTETEVARLAHTRPGSGTSRLGLFRALKILTRGKPGMRVRIVRCDGESLLRRNRPAVITVGLTENPRTEEEIKAATLWNWQPGAVHDVTFLGRDETNPLKIRIGEPEFGLEKWDAGALDFLYKNMAIFIEG